MIHNRKKLEFSAEGCNADGEHLDSPLKFYTQRMGLEDPITKEKMAELRKQLSLCKSSLGAVRCPHISSYSE